jgi:subtilisin family serine protease
MERHVVRHGGRRISRQHGLLALGLAAAALAAADLSTAPGRGVQSPATRTQQAPPRPLGAAAAGKPYQPGTVLVGFRPGTSAAQRARVEHAAGASAARRLGPAIKPAGRGRVASQEFLSPYALHVPASRERAVIARLRRSSVVAYAEPDYTQSASATPNDPSFSVQWADRNTGQSVPTQEINEVVGAEAPGTPGADDGAAKGWQVTTGSHSIVIGETDTGVDYTHPDLAASIWSNPGNVGGCASGTHGFNVLNQTCNPMDEDTTYGGHGTHVAGIMGAVANNGQGVAGIDWNATILPVRWMNNASGGATSALIEALQWLVAAKQSGVNIRVENDSDTFFGTAYSQALSNEIDVLGANNILFVTSAGNTGNNNDEVAVQRYPCSYDRPTEICVAPVNNNDELPSWANYGPHTVDMAAPGVSIYSTLRGGTYGYLSGSSMAAPQVSGAAALILSVEPELSTTALKADIVEHVDHLPTLAGRLITGGTLDVCKALPGCASSRPAVPANNALPTISGSAVEGQTLTEAHGSWSEEPTSYAYRWLRCNTAGESCQLRSGATAQTYVPVSGDLGHTLRVQEIASNGAGASVPASSAPSAVVVATAPVNSSKPTISGTPDVGQTLTASPGTWKESPTAYSYQWLRCDARGGACTPIPFATTSSYVPVEADIRSTLRVAVMATNAAGSSLAATSSPTATVAPAPNAPSNISPPTISGSAALGQTLTEGRGSWTKEPTSFAYGWLRCNPSGTSCQQIFGASGQSYLPVARDVGHTLRALEVASNAAGSSAPAESAPSAVVVATAPFASSLPTITGATTVGETLTASTGAWKESPTTYAYQWLRCDASGSNCAAIALATISSYTLVEADAGATLRVAVVASNAAGSSAPATSSQTTTVTWKVPISAAPPAITGSAQSGQTLSASTGSWSGVPTAFAYRWLRCNASGASCAAIAGASAATYLVGEGDWESTLRVEVTASNPAGSSQPAVSTATGLVRAPQPPTNTVPPSISGTAQQGETLTVAHGSWTGEPTSYSHQWLRCDEAGGNCQKIFGATAQTYVPIAGDVGHTLRVQETATNASGSSNPEGSQATAAVAAQPGAATFGKTTVGAFRDEGLFADYKIVQSATLPVAGSVSQLSVYSIPGFAAPSPQSLKAVIYSDSGGAPGALLATGSEVVYRANVNGSGWFDLPLSATVALQPGTYWIGFITGPTSEGMGYAYDGVAHTRAYNANPFAAGPTEEFGPATFDSEQASIYASYLPTG